MKSIVKSKNKAFRCLDEGYIGKPVPFTPTFLGVFILRQYYQSLSKSQIPQVEPLFAEAVVLEV